jgi:hypothetical protein
VKSPLKPVKISLICAGLLLCLVGTPSCSNCTDSASAGLNIRVVDSSNDQPICDAVVFATEGKYSERLSQNSPNCTYSGAVERSGNYNVTASREGC